MTGPGALRPVMLRIGKLQVDLLFCPDFQGLLSMSRSLQCLASVISIAAIAATREIHVHARKRPTWHIARAAPRTSMHGGEVVTLIFVIYKTCGQTNSS